MTPMRSQSRSASPMMCVLSSTQLPAARRSSTNSTIAPAARMSRPVVGSSRIRTGGSCSTARAIETFCFWPVESPSVRPSAKGCMSKARTSSSMRASRASPPMPCSSPK
jgi:hypothetical protein